MKFKKGSAAAKAFMAKLRAAKGKPKLKVNAKLKKGSLGAVLRKTEDVWIVYGYYPTGKEEVYTAKTSTEAKQIAKNYKENEPYRFTIAPKRIKKGLGAVKKSPAKSYHKDTKSHNVNVRVVSGLDKVTRRGKKTSVHYSRMSGIKLMHKYTITLSTNDYDYVYGFANTLTEANKIFKNACLVEAKDILRTGAKLVIVNIYDNDKNSTKKEKVLINKN
jgi:hypothetical protein